VATISLVQYTSTAVGLIVHLSLRQSYTKVMMQLIA